MGTEKGIGERADQVWASIQKKQEEVFAVRSSETEGTKGESVQEIGLAESETSVAPADQTIPPAATPDSASALKFGMPPPSQASRRRQGRACVPEQFSLF